MDNYYTYAYLREDGTPYYIGKGQGNRAFKKHRVKVPPRDRVLFLKTNLTEQEALQHEIYMIAVLGRKDLGTGILWNFTDGGQGSSGWVMPPEIREKVSKAKKGRPNGRKGYKASPETLQRQREGVIKAGIVGAKPVLGTRPDGEIFYFDSIKEAARRTGIVSRNIAGCCKGDRKTAGTWTWNYFE